MKWQPEDPLYDVESAVVEDVILEGRKNDMPDRPIMAHLCGGFNHPMSAMTKMV